MIWVAIVALVGVIALALVGWLGVQRIRRSLNAIRSENSALRQELQQSQADLAATRRDLGRANTRIEKHDERIKGVRKRVATRLTKLEDTTSQELGTVKDSSQYRNERQDGMVNLVNEVREEVKKTKAKLAEQQELNEELRRRIAIVRTEAHDRQDGQSRLNTELRSGLAEARTTSRAGQALAGRLSGQQIHGSVRALNDETTQKLLDIAPTLGLKWITEEQLRYMEHTVVALEARLRGRLAAPVEAMILRAMVVMAAPRSDATVLEIGTLYGLSACYFHEVVRPQRSGLHQTIIDPFMGYYEQGAPDLFTPIPITREVAVENLIRVGATDADYEIVVGLSEDPDVQAALRDHKFDVVVIDGDHSYDGVRRDFENYADHVVDGGFVIIDDYRGPSWPDVTRFVDETVFTDPRFEIVTGELRTAVVRRVS